MVKTYIFPFDKVEKGSKIILYGASDIGMAYLGQILKMEYCECLFVADRNSADIKLDCDVPLHSPAKIFNSVYDYIVVASTWASKEIIAYLIENGVPVNKIVNSIVKIEQNGYKLPAGNFYVEYRRLPIDNECIFYESSQGYGMVCNPYAIFKKLFDNPKFSELKHIWSISDASVMNKLQQEYINYPNVKFVLRSDSDNYAYYQAISKYIVQNTSHPVYFAKRDEQVLLNTWHSITVKTLGFDVPNGFVDVRNMLRCLMMSDYIVSANRFMTDIFLKSHKLDGLYNGRIIQEGHPRTDLTFNTRREDAIEKLVSFGVEFDPKKNAILYAPTWRGHNVQNVSGDFEPYLSVLNYLERTIDSDEYQILIKPHTYTYRKLSKKEQNFCKLIPPFMDTNELLSAIDILISDYSSIYFDFMVLDRPILFFVPDYEDYNKERGVVFEPDELPGPVTVDLCELAELIKNIDEVEEKYKSIYSSTKEWACKHDDGFGSQRVIDVVFNNKRNYSLLAGNNDKIKILFYPGLMEQNEITEIFITFLESVDYGKYDVSVHCHNKNIETLRRIPDSVRIFVRYGNNTLSFAEKSNLHTLLKKDIKDDENFAVIDHMFERDFLRCFGNATFDYVVDFSGCDTEFTLMLSMAKNAKKYICLHDDKQQALPDTVLKILVKRFDKAITVNDCIEQFESLFT